MNIFFRIARWLIFFPVAIGVFLAGSILLSSLMFLIFSVGSAGDIDIINLFGNTSTPALLSAAGAIWIGAYIAPSRKLIVAGLISIAVIFILGFDTYVIYRFMPLENRDWELLINLFELVGITIGIFAGFSAVWEME